MLENDGRVGQRRAGQDSRNTRSKGIVPRFLVNVTSLLHANSVGEPVSALIVLLFRSPAGSRCARVGARIGSALTFAGLLSSPW
jgi:hypothetical protein